METLKIDSEDYEDLIVMMEKSFGIRFETDDVENNMSIDDLANLVIAKVGLEPGNECSTQIVFYRLRQLFMDKLGFDKHQIKTQTALKTIFPSEKRREKWYDVFNNVDLDIPGLLPPMWLIGSLGLCIPIAVIFLFASYWVYGSALLLASLSGIYIANKLGKTLPATTIGDLAKLIARHNYRKTRGHLNNINVNEVKTIIFDMMTDWLYQHEIEKVSMDTKICY